MCEYCKPDKQALSKPGHPHEFIIDDGAIFYYDSLDGWEGEKIDYCPYCNQRLTPEDPLTLEELKEMEEQPYWHVSLTGHGDGYKILPEHVAKSPKDYKYGERWLAYRHKPIEEA